MKNYFLLGALLLLTPASPAGACINHYERPARPPRKSGPDAASEYMANLRDQSEHDRMVAGTPPADPGPNADFKLRNDYAATLVHRGEAQKAVDILESIEKSRPGEYAVAANLGTAYELSGDLVKAHQWISEGIRRNPGSHEGTEWLHLLILEARQGLLGDPQWLRKRSVTGLDFGSAAEPRMPHQWPKAAGTAEQVITALTYQLRERMAFVKAPDLVVGSLLSDLAVMLLLYRSPDVAIPVFDLALSYRPVKADTLAARKSVAEEIIRSRKSGDNTLKLMLFALGSLAIVGVLLLQWRPGRGTRSLVMGPRRLRRPS